MVDAEVQQIPALANLQDAKVLGGISATDASGQGYFFRVRNILKAGQIRETEVEILELRSGTLPLRISWSLVECNSIRFTYGASFSGSV